MVCNIKIFQIMRLYIWSMPNIAHDGFAIFESRAKTYEKDILVIVEKNTDFKFQ